MAFLPGSCPARRPGFTLIELLVCVAIIALLIGLLLPALGKARERSRATVCLTRLRNLQVATYVYAEAYKVPPVTVALAEPLEVLEMPGQVWSCPSERPMTGPSSYVYLAPLHMVSPPGAALQMQSLRPYLAMRAYDQNNQLPLYWDAEMRHEHDCNVVYWDG